MLRRVTVAHLEGIIARINRMTGSPAEPYRRENGRLIGNIGNYHLSRAYGGYSLHRMHTEGGGVSDPLRCGHVSARELQSLMFAWIEGRASAECASAECASMTPEEA